MHPGHIICWSVSGKAVHRSDIILDKGDSVARCSLKRVQRSLLTPLIKNFLGVIKTAQDHECLTSVGVMLSRGYRGMFDRPIKLLQSIFRSTHLGVSNPQEVGSNRTAWIRLLVQSKYGCFLFQIARYGRIIESGGLKILFLGETAILELESPGEILSGSLAVINAVIRAAQHAESRAELRIEFSGRFKKRNSLTPLTGTIQRLARSIGL